MFRPSPVVISLICALCIGWGCASARKKKAPPPKPAVAQSVLVGTITLVNEKGNFVLIDDGSLPSAPSGVKLKTYTAGVASGELETTDVRRHPFTIADIRSGKPLKGDRVYFEQPHAAPPVAPGAATPGPISRGIPSLPTDLPPQIQ